MTDNSVQSVGEGKPTEGIGVGNSQESVTRQSEREAKKKLTPKQDRFCREYITDLNATQAAIRAGYSAKTAYSMGSRLLKNVEIQARLAEVQKELAGKLQITPESVLREWRKLAFVNMADYVRITPDGEPVIDLSKCTREQMAALSETQVEDYVEGRGENARDVKRIRVKMHSKTQALEALSKHLGLFEADNRQKDITVKVIDYKDAESTGFNPDGSRKP